MEKLLRFFSRGNSYILHLIRYVMKQAIYNKSLYGALPEVKIYFWSRSLLKYWKHITVSHDHSLSKLDLHWIRSQPILKFIILFQQGWKYLRQFQLPSGLLGSHAASAFSQPWHLIGNLHFTSFFQIPVISSWTLSLYPSTVLDKQFALGCNNEHSLNGTVLDIDSEQPW